MWFPYAAPFYIARIGEMRPTLIVSAAMVAIGIIVWKKTPTLGRVDCRSRCWRDCLDLH